MGELTLPEGFLTGWQALVEKEPWVTDDMAYIERLAKHGVDVSKPEALRNWVEPFMGQIATQVVCLCDMVTIECPITEEYAQYELAVAS